MSEYKQESPYYATLVTYTCGCISTHNRHVQPAPVGDDAYCLYHDRTVLVAKHTAEYVTRCRTCKRPKYQYYGMAKVTALTKASAHAIRTRHTVEIWHGEELVEVTGPDAPGQMPLMLF